MQIAGMEVDNHRKPRRQDPAHAVEQDIVQRLATQSLELKERARIHRQAYKIEARPAQRLQLVAG